MYAARPVIWRCNGVPTETLGWVTRLELANDWNDLHQFAHAAAPCHECGGISSMIPAEGAHNAIHALISSRLNAEIALLKTAMTALLSDADARSPDANEKIVAARSATVTRKIFIDAFSRQPSATPLLSHRCGVGARREAVNSKKPCLRRFYLPLL